MSSTSDNFALYNRSVRYPTDAAALAAYSKAQDLIFTTECALSVYRLRYQDEPYVVVLGRAPSKEINDELGDIFKDGKHEFLPADIFLALQRRRAAATRLGIWVEGHYE